MSISSGNKGQKENTRLGRADCVIYDLYIDLDFYGSAEMFMYVWLFQ